MRMSATPLAMQSFYNQNKSSTPGMNQYSNIKSPSGPSGSPYLPNYLLGSSTSPANTNVPGGYGRLLSNSGSGHQTHNHRVSSRSPPSQGRNLGYSSPPERKLQRFSPPSGSTRKEKPGAPPIEGLYCTPNAFENSMERDCMTNKRALFSATPGMGEQFYTPNNSQTVMSPPPQKENVQMFSPRKNVTSSVQSPAQVDPFYSQGDNLSSTDILDDTAVTVFGFPPAASSFILQQFSQYGSIEKHEIHNTGNWLHIKYLTKIQAKKALSKNGKIFSRSIMIGVCPCIKKDIASMEDDLIGTNSTMNSTFGGTPGKPVIGTKRHPSSIRSLSTASATTPLHGSVGSDVFAEKGTPQKKDSVVTKALDYVFGW